MTSPQYVRDDHSLRRTLDRFAGEPTIALDTEFLRESTYFPKLCLVQLASDEHRVAVDPFECRDLSPLWELLTDGREVLVHAGRQDLEIVDNLHGSLPSRVFDTQVAASLVGLGHTIGYARLVNACAGVSLKRSEAYTDWSRRPLSEEQIEYALDDVRYLHACRRWLASRLEQLGRSEWAAEEFASVQEAVRTSTSPDSQWQRVSGARSLPADRIVILQAVARWREEESMRRDLPRRRTVPDRALVEIARRVPKSAKQLGRIRGLRGDEVRRSGAAIVDVVREAMKVPEKDWPRWPHPTIRETNPQVQIVATLLDAFVRARAEDVDIASRLLTTRDQLEALVRAYLVDPGDLPTRLPILEGWRREVAGDDILRVLRGELAIRVAAADGAPRLVWGAR
jgi:ribonuclease D